MECIIRETYLQANSQKHAFYKLVTEKITDGFVIRKESGVGEGKVLHTETYFRNSLGEAIQFHEKKIKEKTGSNRKRAYFIIFDRDRNFVQDRKLISNPLCRTTP